MKKNLCILLIICLSFTACQSVKSSNPSRTLEEQIGVGLISTGLKPIFPEQATCLEVASFFGDRTRHDGSLRVPWSNNGLHGGIDISIPIGKPIVAIADGTVVQVAKAGRLVGIKITLQHAPKDTGLPIWIYSKYQHLHKFPELKEGDKVKMGQIIGLAGRTGTTGGHYGREGYPHLHMNVYSSKTNKYKVMGHKLIPENMQYHDPLALYFRKEIDSNLIRKMPDKEKSFHIPYKDNTGKVFPNGSKFIWPFICEEK